MNLLLILIMAFTPYPNPKMQPRQQSQPEVVRVTATAYCLTGNMTNGQKTHPGCIALSRDLVKMFGLQNGRSPFDCKFGSIIMVEGVGQFIFKDLMPPKWSKRVDIWLPSVKACHAFSVKRVNLWVVKRS